MFTDELAQAATKKKEFLAQIERIIPWSEWIGMIQPHYYKGERGNKPYDLELMLRIYLVQNLYNLSDMSTMTEVIDSRAFSDFCGVDSTIIAAPPSVSIGIGSGIPMLIKSKRETLDTLAAVSSARNFAATCGEVKSYLAA